MTAPAQENKRGRRASRDKGNGLERAIVRLLQDHGLGAERIPLSGSAGGSFSGDVTTPLIGRDLTIGRDALIIKADRRDALVVLPLRLAVEIATAAERRKA